MAKVQVQALSPTTASEPEARGADLLVYFQLLCVETLLQLLSLHHQEDDPDEDGHKEAEGEKQPHLQRVLVLQAYFI